MKNKIALGFHGCIDFECEWDIDTIHGLIQEFAVSFSDLADDGEIDSERKILLAVLRHMLRGIGGEFVPESSSVVYRFAQRFQYRVTIGGTAARAAIAIQKLGYGSALQSCCNNALFRKHLPKEIQFISSVAEREGDVYPHVSLQYPAGCRIRLLDGSFVTSHPNRVLFSRDPDSIAMRITDRFYPMISEAEVFLLSCFSEMLEEDLLISRLEDTIATIRSLSTNRFVFMEDGCYTKKNFRTLAHSKLAPHINALSMNEDEFFELLGHDIDLLSPDQAEAAVKEIYGRLHIPNLIVHTALWALAYGNDAQRLKQSITCGVVLASTRFRLGDDFNQADYTDTALLGDHPEGKAFCEALNRSAGAMVCCIPGKKLNHVKTPTTVGLGDYFAGGLVAGMAE